MKSIVGIWRLIQTSARNDAGEPPLRAGMTAYVSIDTKRTRSLAKIFGSGDAAAAKP